MTENSNQPALPSAAPPPAATKPRALQDAHQAKAAKKRRGIVIVAVLVVVAALSLAGYHYTNMMMSEYKASDYSHRNIQARVCAESGIHYTAALLSDPNLIANKLNNLPPWNNPDVFQNQTVLLDKDGINKGYFSIIAPTTADDPTYPYGLYAGPSDESAKINVNVMMKVDQSGQKLYTMLMLLPNMTSDIANNIIAWMGGTSDSVGVAGGGEGDDYYTSLGYHCKSGPLDSIDELLLVKDVTRDLLYGTDDDRNGAQDPNNPNEGRNNGFDRGWSAYLTVHSREQNAMPNGAPLIWLNDPDYLNLFNNLSPVVGDDMANFVIMCRKKGFSNGTPNAKMTVADISTYTPNYLPNNGSDYPINSLFSLVDAYVTISTFDPTTKKATAKVYVSPLSNYAQETDLLVKFFSSVTLQNPTVVTDTTTGLSDPSTGPELPARININTAPLQVLTALTDESISPLTANDVTNIISARDSLDPTTPIYNTPAWLLTTGAVSLKTLQNPGLQSLITAKTQVYRVQSVGYFGDKGPFCRLEAVIDTNSGRPRILMMRDLTELGKGLPPLQQ